MKMIQGNQKFCNVDLLSVCENRPYEGLVWFGLLGFTASATARVISRRCNDDEISFRVEETGVPGGNHHMKA